MPAEKANVEWTGGDRKALLLLTGLVLVFFGELIVSPGSILYSVFSDIVLQRSAWQALIRKTLLEQGELPLWYPNIFCGMPFIGNPESWAFYPVNWLFVLLPPNLSISYLVILHFLVGAAGFFIFLRKGLKVSTGPAFLGTLYFIFGGKWMLHILVPGHTGFLSLAWVPWAMLWTDRLVARPGWRERGVLAILLGLMGVSLLPQLLLYVTYFLIVYFFLRLFQSARGTRKKAFGGFVLSGVVGILMSLVQLLPAASAAAVSARAAFGSQSFSAVGSLNGHDFVALLYPDMKPETDVMKYWAGDTYAWEKSFHFGWLPILLLPFWPLKERRGEVIFLCVFAGVAFLHALGSHTPFYGWVYQWVPGMRFFRGASRTLFLVGLCVPCLIALSAEKFLYTRELRLHWGAAGLLAFGLIMLKVGAGQKWLLLAGPVLASAAVVYALSVFFHFRKPATPNLAVGCLVFGFLFESWWFLWPMREIKPIPEAFRSPVIAALRERPQVPGRVADRHREIFSTLLPEKKLVENGLSDVNGYNPLVSERYARFMARAIGKEPEPEVWIPSLKPALKNRYLDLESLWAFAGVTPGGPGWYVATIEERPGALPRAYVVPKAVVIENAERLLESIGRSEFDPRVEVLLEKQPERNDGSCSFQSVSFESYSANQVKLEVAMDKPGFLVLTDAWHAGWVCEDFGRDGGGAPEALEIYRANYLFRAVYLSAGPHRLLFDFRPWQYRVGRVCSLVAFLLALAAILWPDRKQAPLRVD